MISLAFPQEIYLHLETNLLRKLGETGAVFCTRLSFGSKELLPG